MGQVKSISGGMNCEIHGVDFFVYLLYTIISRNKERV